MLHDRIERAHYWPLPDHAGESSTTRRTGIEIEFSGLGVGDTATLIQRLWGGTIRPLNTRACVVEGGRHGDVQVELDISLQKAWLEDLATQALGDLVPVEIITSPLGQDQLAALTDLARALEEAGGMGTQARLGFGFGVHLNPEVPTGGAENLVMIIRAYALLEDWLRNSAPLDPARRALPFVNPWPAALVDALADQARWSVPDLARLYAMLAPARGYGLDLLPVFEHLCPEALTEVPQSQLKGGRPTFHYRLAESRFGDPGWSLAYEWNRWVLVERVAADAALLAQLASGWQAHRDRFMPRRQNWIDFCEDVLSRWSDLTRS
ncbi:MAG: amidoligase family protein [Natronohydrobacter sp.]|nr:amidoligase family protein [Natronohydrobacter sp.]